NGVMPDLAGLIEKRTTSEPLLRRVRNANFHFGTRDSAKALAGFAARRDGEENRRVEALAELAAWPHPAGRDLVAGLWRPVAPPLNSSGDGSTMYRRAKWRRNCNSICSKRRLNDRRRW